MDPLVVGFTDLVGFREAIERLEEMTHAAHLVVAHKSARQRFRGATK